MKVRKIGERVQILTEACLVSKDFFVWDARGNCYSFRPGFNPEVWELKVKDEVIAIGVREPGARTLFVLKDEIPEQFTEIEAIAEDYFSLYMEDIEKILTSDGAAPYAPWFVEDVFHRVEEGEK